MKLTYTYIPFRLYPAILLGLLYTVMQAMAFHPLLNLPLGTLLLKCFIDALILLSMGWLLGIVVPSSNYVRLGTYQRFINYLAIGVLFVFAWVMMGFLTSYLTFNKEQFSQTRILLPANAFSGALLYVIFALLIHIQIVNRKGADEDEEDADMGEAEEKGVVESTSFSPNDHVHGVDLERIAVKVGQKIHVILVNDIVYIRSDGDYVQIVTDQHNYIKEETMKYFETNLPALRFVRVHRSYIVNVEKILRIELYEKQTQMLTLNNGDKIRASAAGYKALRLALKL